MAFSLQCNLRAKQPTEVLLRGVLVGASTPFLVSIVPQGSSKFSTKQRYLSCQERTTYSTWSSYRFPCCPCFCQLEYFFSIFQQNILAISICFADAYQKCVGQCIILWLSQLILACLLIRHINLSIVELTTLIDALGSPYVSVHNHSFLCVGKMTLPTLFGSLFPNGTTACFACKQNMLSVCW